MTAGTEAAFQAALQAHQTGNLQAAFEGYNAVLRAEPQNPYALHYLGVVVYQRGDTARAVALIEQAFAAKPDFPEAHYNLGNIYRETGRSERAESCYRTVLRLDPNYLDALNNLAGLMWKRGALGEAEALFRRLVERAPRDPGAHAILGAVLLEAGKAEEATAQLSQAAELAPGNPRILFDLGVAFEARGDLNSAETTYRKAAALSPRSSDALNNLGNVLVTKKRYDDAIDIFETLARRNPGHPGYVRNLGNALHLGGRLMAALSIYRRALELAPNDAEIHSNIAAVFLDQGRVGEAIASYRRALEIHPEFVTARSNMLFALCFKEDAEPGEVYAEHRRFDELHARPLSVQAAPHANDRNPNRRLRIGYLSPDFRRHPGGHFLLPIVEHCDRAIVDLYAYSDTLRQDGFTARFRRAADHWRDAHGRSDDALARLIREDEIDILVDCAGHMKGNRLLVFARRPAPIQFSFPLYPNTTGLSAIDYRIMDPHFAPPSADALHSERLIRLPQTHVCYEPGDRSLGVANRPPCADTGIVTFGSFNNVAKLGERTVAIWARILDAVPGSRLRVKWLGLGDGESRWVTGRFAQHGIPENRILLSPWSQDPYRPYLDIDICLDPLFANGGTTTCDALWMGVPVVTRFGETPFSRVGLGHLTNVGLPELIAGDDDAYVRIAVDLARSPERLVAIRSGLRERFAASPLMDAARYVRHLEAAYRECWRAWCGAR
jgi:predicted O-linked N-acetylglucosamine transferase (SPINDLY family)